MWMVIFAVWLGLSLGMSGCVLGQEGEEPVGLGTGVAVDGEEVLEDGKTGDDGLVVDDQADSGENGEVLDDDEAGEIKLLGFLADGEITTYSSRVVVYGEVLGMDKFVIEKIINGVHKERSRHVVNVKGMSLHDGSSFRKREGVKYNKFHFGFGPLEMGENVIELELYPVGEEQVEPLDKKKIVVNYVESSDEVVQVELLDEPEVVGPQEFFENVLSVNLEEDEIWDYIQYSVMDERYEDRLLYPMGGLSFEIHRLGEVEIEQEKWPVYRVEYLEPEVTYMFFGPSVNTVVGYVKNNQFYYFANAFWIYEGHSFRFYMKSSSYILPDLAGDLDELAIPDSQDVLVKNGGFQVCDDEIMFANDEFLFDVGEFVVFKGYKDEFEVLSEYMVRDKYGLCKEYDYKFPGYKDGEVEGVKRPWNYQKLAMDFDDGQEIDAFYSPFRHVCAGRVALRELPAGYEDYLEKVGKITGGQDVFVFAQDAPVLNDEACRELSFVEKNTDPVPFCPAEMSKGGDPDFAKWQGFLAGQKENYPLLIIKNAFDEWMVLVRQEYAYLPGC